MATLLKEELAQTVTLAENGRRKRMSKGKALVKKTVNDALGNDAKARSLVFDQEFRIEGANEASSSFNFDSREDALVIESAIRRIQLAEEPPIATGGASEDDGGKP